MFADSGLIEKMSTDFDTEVISKLDWEKGIT